MAKFHVGQRVRFVRGTRPMFKPFLNKECTIVGLGAGDGSWDCRLAFGERIVLGGITCGDNVGAMFAELESLTDPKADQFIESIKNLSRPTKNRRFRLRRRPMPLIADQAAGALTAREIAFQSWVASPDGITLKRLLIIAGICEKYALSTLSIAFTQGMSAGVAYCIQIKEDMPNGR